MEKSSQMSKMQTFLKGNRQKRHISLKVNVYKLTSLKTKDSICLNGIFAGVKENKRSRRAKRMTGGATLSYTRMAQMGRFIPRVPGIERVSPY